MKLEMITAKTVPYLLNQLIQIPRNIISSTMGPTTHDAKGVMAIVAGVIFLMSKPCINPIVNTQNKFNVNSKVNNSILSFNRMLIFSLRFHLKCKKHLVQIIIQLYI